MSLDIYDHGEMSLWNMGYVEYNINERDSMKLLLCGSKKNPRRILAGPLNDIKPSSFTNWVGSFVGQYSIVQYAIGCQLGRI